jgi:hypothetical protein
MKKKGTTEKADSAMHNKATSSLVLRWFPAVSLPFSAAEGLAVFVFVFFIVHAKARPGWLRSVFR